MTQHQPPLGQRPRWEQAAERARKRAPVWLDFDRMPWWLALLIGTAWIAWGGYRLVTGDSLYDRMGAAVLMCLPSAGMFMGARRLRQRKPFYKSSRPPR